jgi:hypothetical protein
MIDPRHYPKEGRTTMPRRRIPAISVPSRLDSRRAKGNAKGAQRRPYRGRRGQLENVAERRVRAFELRKAGSSYREIARQLGVDVHTAHADVGAELDALRETTVAEATELRALELERLDTMTSGLWPHIKTGNAPAVTAGVRVSERRARLLGLDAPVATKSEVTGSLGVYAERLAAERQLLRDLSVPQLEELAAESQALMNKAMAMVRANGCVSLPDDGSAVCASLPTGNVSPDNESARQRHGDGEATSTAGGCTIVRDTSVERDESTGKGQANHRH